MTADLMARARAGDGDARMELARAANRAGRRAEAEHWIVEAAAVGQLAALFQTGVWKLIGHRGPRDVEAGSAIVRDAAAAGEPAAKAMLATLALSPAMAKRDWDAARRLIVEAAEAHDPRALLQLALMLPNERKWHDTRLALADRAAARGFASALYFAGRLLLEGGGQEAQALARLTIAARANEPNALRVLRSRRTAAAEVSSPAFELTPVSFARVAEALRWPHERALPQIVARQTAPRIATLNRLLTAEECDYLISRGAPHLKPGVIAGAPTGEAATNAAASFGLIESDPLIQSIDERISQALNLPASHGERLALLHYMPGQKFGAHGDFIDPDRPGHAAELAANGQRIRTLIVYLNDGFEGGETLFPRIGWHFRGKRGDALMWDNVDAAGAIDPRSLHEGTSPRAADKFVLSKWARDRPQPADRR